MEFVIELFAELLLYPVGAFICWAFTGFRGSFREELTEHDTRNSVVALIFFALVAAVFFVKKP